jgi:hypothetical protein
MSKTIKTKIDGVPVELEIINVGPSSPIKLHRLSENLAKEIDVKQPFPPTQVRVLKVGSDEQPATPKDVQRIKEQVDNTPTELVVDLIESLTSIPEGKKWWQSKTIWVNIAAMVAATTALFGLPIHINPEVAMTLYPIVLGVVNLFLRSKTNQGLNHVIKRKKA